MRQLVDDYEQQKDFKSNKAKQTVLAIRDNHPIFSRVSDVGFNYLLKNSVFYKLQSGQFIYKEKGKVGDNLYFIMYGCLKCICNEVGTFGADMIIGHTLGEETIFA